MFQNRGFSRSFSYTLEKKWLIINWVKFLTTFCFFTRICKTEKNNASLFCLVFWLKNTPPLDLDLVRRGGFCNHKWFLFLPKNKINYFIFFPILLTMVFWSPQKYVKLIHIFFLIDEVKLGLTLNIAPFFAVLFVTQKKP